MTPNSPDEPFNDDPDMELEPLDELESVDSTREWTPPPEKVGEVAKRVVSDAEAGWRLDLFLAAKFPQYSRVLIRKAIQAEEGVDVSGMANRPFDCDRATSSPFGSSSRPAKAPFPRTCPLTSSMRTTISQSSTSRRTWSFIPLEDTGPARS